MLADRYRQLAHRWCGPTAYCACRKWLPACALFRWKGLGYIGDQIVGLIVNLPDTGSFKKIKISLSCYIMANAPGTKIEGAFYEKEIKDGLRGKRWVANLLRMKGRWTAFSKTLTIPAKANSLRLTFFGLESSGIKDRIVCFDTIAITAFK